MRRFFFTLGLIASAVASGAPESPSSAFEREFVTAAESATPEPSPSVSPRPRLRLFGRRPTPTPTPSPSPSPTPAPTPSPTGVPSPTPVPEVTRAPSPSPKPTSADRAFSLAGGTWECESMAEGRGTHTYEQTNEFTLVMVNRISLGGRTYTIDETYRFDPATERWSNTTGNDAYVGTADPWTGERWVFDGVEALNGVRHAVRMIYIDLGGAAFRRDFQMERERRWTTFSAETCKRPVS